MLIIGADRQDRTEDEESGRVFRGAFAQLMVFANGLILTAVAFVTLNFFIHDMLREERHGTVQETERTISENLSELESAIKTLSTILVLTHDVADRDLPATVAYGAPHLDRFDYLYWIRPAANGGWSVVDLLRHGDRNSALSGELSESYALNSEEALRNLVAHVTSSRVRVGEDVQISTDVPGTEYVQENLDPLLKARPFALIKKIMTPDRDTYLVGLSRVSGVIDKGWLTDRPEIDGLILREESSGRPVLYMTRSSRREPDMVRNDYKFKIGNANWSMQVDIGGTRHAAFLKNTPILVGMFGILLTLIGTMYVRNNQSQSRRLAAMNRTLAHKNFELNSEISERERLNAVLRKSERENRAVINAVSDIIFETSTEGDFLFLNETWEKVTGFDIDRALGRNLFDMIHPQDQQEQKQNFVHMVKGQKPAYRSFTRLRTSEGTFRSVELAISMLRQDESRNMRVVGTLTDVEERRRAEKALGEAEKKYRTIVENAAGGIYQVTPEGQYLSANPAMARILGYDSPDEILRNVRNAHEDVYANIRDRLNLIRDLEEKGIVKNAEIQVRRKDGGNIWVNENARAVRDDEGNILYFEGSVEDVTQRKEAQIKLHDAKMRSDLANRAKSEFLANMSHELRTPLNAIIGFSEIIKNEVFGPVGQKQYWEYARDIYDSGKQLLKIINEILDVSRIEAGERQLNEGVVRIDRLVASSIEMMQPKIEDSGLTVINTLDENVPQVIGEELAIKQILMNILSNAVKFTPAGGRVTASYEMDAEGQLRLSITDTGIGLDESEIEKALSPFGQVDSSLHRATSGTGLGLTLVDALIRLHGGSLELFSQKGLGTTATIIFPARRVAVREQAHAVPPADGQS